MVTKVSTTRNIQLNVEMIITSHTGIKRITLNIMPSHCGFSLPISVECACVERYSWVYCTR